MHEREAAAFAQARPRSRALFERARQSLPGGVPMNWMVKWPGGVPLFMRHASGARLTDADGHEYVDFCLGDTGAMAGHSPSAAIPAVQEQLAAGITAMLPTEDAAWVGEELARRFGLPYWQFSLTATDANRFALRIARQVTGRPLILVFNYCYHGSVDETLATATGGSVGPRRGNIGPAVDPADTTRVIEFNDVDSIEAALAREDVACVLAEPALTNIGIVLPDPGFHDRLRELCTRHGSLLAIDETHTICAGPGGYTGAHDLRPDVVTIGKSIAAGVPAAAYGFTAEVAERLGAVTKYEDSDVSGVGGTLAGNALSLAAIRATLANVLTEDAFEVMIALAERLDVELDEIVRAHELPWHATRLGCRVEYVFSRQRPRNGSEAAAVGDFELDQLLHLYMLNRGVLLTPFHNMALISPSTTEADVARHGEVLREFVSELTA
jgi:glutamate-1-semialdehyde 2,1-aminomutase